jgi:hypothetical protein
MALRSQADMGKLITLVYLGSYPSYPVSTKKPDLSAIRLPDRRCFQRVLWAMRSIRRRSDFREQGSRPKPIHNDDFDLSSNTVRHGICAVIGLSVFGVY